MPKGPARRRDPGWRGELRNTKPALQLCRLTTSYGLWLRLDARDHERCLGAQEAFRSGEIMVTRPATPVDPLGRTPWSQSVESRGHRREAGDRYALESLSGIPNRAYSCSRGIPFIQAFSIS